MTKNKPLTSDSGSPVLLLFVYLISSFFSGLLFSIFAYRAKSRNRNSFWWGLLSLICIAVFSVLSFSLFRTSSPNHDAVYFYIGFGSLITNAMALLILLITVFKTSEIA